MTVINTRHGQINIAHKQDYISQQLINHGEYEWYVIDLIQQLVGTKTGCILDIGANIGTVSLPLARDLPHMIIHAFEVQPYVAELLEQNIRLNQLNNIQLHNHGLGNESTKLIIQSPDYDQADNIGAFSLNSLVHKHSSIARGQGQSIQVNIQPLDDIHFDQPIQCIKLDVEGYEYSVIQGALNTLKQHNYPPIVYELWGYNAWWADSAKKFREYLESLGYTIQQINDTGVATQ